MAQTRCTNYEVSIDFWEVPQYRLSATVSQRLSGLESHFPDPALIHPGSRFSS